MTPKKLHLKHYEWTLCNLHSPSRYYAKYCVRVLPKRSFLSIVVCNPATARKLGSFLSDVKSVTLDTGPRLRLHHVHPMQRRALKVTCTVADSHWLLIHQLRWFRQALLASPPYFKDSLTERLTRQWQCCHCENQSGFFFMLFEWFENHRKRSKNTKE